MGKPDEESNVYLDMTLFYGKFPKFGKYEHEVRGKIHIKEEYRRYRKEIFPLKNREGRRTYVRMMPYNAGEIGKVVSSRQEGYYGSLIGVAQAWYYPTDKVIVLWECVLDEVCRIDSLGIDGNTLKLWTSFEKILLERFPLTEYMVTSNYDPAYDVEPYQRFLHSLGYNPMQEAQEAWRKSLKNDSL